MIKLLVAILIAFTAANTLAGTMYIYKDKNGQVLRTNVHTDNEEILKKKLMQIRKQVAEQQLVNMQINREKGMRVSDKDEVLFSLNDIDNDVGAKIGMTKEQVLSRTHWGSVSPDYVHKVEDKNGELEQWFYREDGALYFDKGKLSSIQLFR